MRVGFFGGSFDPPHNGHLAVARAAAEAFHLDEVLLVPTASQPLKPAGAQASFDDRLAMTQLLCADANRTTPDLPLKASSLEAPRSDGRPNYTVDTLRRLRTEHPANQLFVLVGADAFLGLRDWRSPEQLLRLAEWIVVSRPGIALDSLQLTPEQRPRVHLLQTVNVPVSATALREKLAHRQDCSAELAPAVLAYIRERHLYTMAAKAVRRD
jgi:nicotinate-nucleotide adenylyltransferase